MWFFEIIPDSNMASVREKDESLKKQKEYYQSFKKKRKTEEKCCLMEFDR